MAAATLSTEVVGLVTKEQCLNVFLKALHANEDVYFLLLLSEEL